MGIYALLRDFYSKAMSKKSEFYINNLVKKGLKLGDNVGIAADFFFDPSHCFLISIGDNTTIAPNVRLIAHDASTKKLLGYAKIGKIEIKENCFIGDSVIVLPNVTIGENSIIGAGSIVTKDIPPNSIAAGNPARIIASIDEYALRIKEQSSNKRKFGEDYIIDRLDEKKREEVLAAISKDGIGFIV